MNDAEVIVVGGGPAGSTIAAELAMAGHDVLLLDKASFPRHKPCSDYVNPAAAQLLDRMGVLESALHLGAREMDGMLVHSPSGHRFLANYAGVEPGRAALGLSRRNLDALLLDRARACGATVLEGAHVRNVIREGETVTGVEVVLAGSHQHLHAPLVIGADGRHSVVRRTLNLEAPLRWPRKTGIAAHYRGVTGLDRWGEMHVGHGIYAGFAPIEDDLTNITIVAGVDAVSRRAGSLEHFFADALRQLPEASSRVRDATREGGFRGVGSMGCRARRTAGSGFLLVGDAASFLDPFAGEGVYEAIHGAMLAAPVVDAALRANDVNARALRPYLYARRQAFTAKRTVSWIVQGFINTPVAMDYVTSHLSERNDVGLTLSGVLGNIVPASRALSPLFLARLLRP